MTSIINRRMRRAARQHIANGSRIGMAIALLAMLGIGWAALLSEMGHGASNVAHAVADQACSAGGQP